jgi:hypothetical protein
VPPRQDHLIELVNHGFLLCLSEDGIKRLRSEWTASVDAYVKHLADVKREDALSQGRLKPIFNDARIAGVVLEMPDGVAVHLNESARGLGLGKTIVQQAYWRQTPIRTISACGVVKYYEEHNFRPEKRPDGDYILHPPLIHDTSPVLKYLAAQGL